MAKANVPSGPAQLSDEQFSRIAEFIEKNVGIKMPPQKKIMVQSRLQARLKATGYRDFDSYIAHAFSVGSQSDEEIALMIDVLTTNLTSFFRENPHFDYMTGTVLPALAEAGRDVVDIWSAACSSGEEPYTLCIVLQEFMRTHKKSFRDYRILGTDISSRVLDKAVNAVYPMDTVENLPFDIKKRYFLRSRDAAKNLVRVKPELRRHVTLERLNFMDGTYPVRTQKDIIFCRNALIYFDKPTQEAVIRKLLAHLVPGGHLFLGHSETIFGMDLPLVTVGPTIFQKTE